jgi:glycosyltransferase involved in cell wall biosynthesis
MARTRLALVVPALTGGGGVPSVARFVMAAAARDGGFDVQLVSLASASADPSSVRLAAPATWRGGVRTREVDWEGHRALEVGVLGAELEFQRYRPRATLTRVLADADIVQVVAGSPAWANAVVGIGKPVALQVATRARVERRLRDASPDGLRGWWRKAMTGVTDRMDDRALQRVDAIQVENPWMLDYARALNAGREVDLRYAPPGVDAGLFHPLDRRSLADDPYVLCVGRLDDPRKNVGLLLEAFACMPEELRARARLVLAGASGPGDAFWSRARALGLDGRVEYVASPDMAALVRLYQQAAVFALASDEEGFGVVLAEAMACAVPVVSTRSGGPDGIITEGHDGFLVALDDAAGMARQLQHLLEDRESNLRMGDNARRTVEARYDERVAGAVFVDMWHRLAARRMAGVDGGLG